jgi:tetratricopeptide (TPR) repeat protein
VSSRTARVIAGLGVCAGLGVSSVADGALTDVARLAAVYGTILQADFERVARQLKETCPPAPQGACDALGVVAVWWQILLDPDSRALDKKFSDLASSAIAGNEAWTKREPGRAEAWFYLAGSYAPLAQWRVLRGERLAAARDGNRIREALERALALDPTLEDAHFGIGLYHYYAAVVPPAARLLRWLLLLPGGDRTLGLREMLEARERGQLISGEADYQLHLVYLWYEHKPADALGLLGTLRSRYPSNPLFLQRIAEVQDQYVHDHPASAAAWRDLLDRARSNRVNAAPLAEARARIGLAAELDAMFETDRAIDQLTAVIAGKPVAPHGARAQAELQLGLAYDRLGSRDLAVAAYTAAVAQAGDDDPPRIRDRARAGLHQAPERRAADAYRLSLEGWRLVERGDASGALTPLAQAMALAPGDPVVRYRYARALDAHGDFDRARAELERVIAAPAAPPIVLASAYVDYAALIERAGDTPRALSLYRDAMRIVGGDPGARDRAARAIKRLAPMLESRNFF